MIADWKYIYDQIYNPNINELRDMNDLLIKAAKEGDEKLVENLILVGVDPSVNNNEAIIVASKYGQIEVAKALVKDKRVDPSANNNQAIIDASTASDLNAELFRYIEYPWQVEGHRETAKMENEFRHMEVIELLLQDPRVDPSAQTIRQSN